MRKKFGQDVWVKGCKERGEWAELCFMARAAGLGMGVLRPFGDLMRFDVAVLERSEDFTGSGEVDDLLPSPERVQLECDGAGAEAVPEGNCGFLCGVSDSGESVVHHSL